MSRTVLLVVGDPDLCEAVAAALHRRGYAVLAVGDADEADAILDQGSPDLLVTEMMLPGRSGFQVARRAKEMSDGRVPVVMVAGQGSPAHRDYALAAGVDAFLAKPFDPADLVTLAVDLAPPPRPGSGTRPVTHAHA